MPSIINSDDGVVSGTSGLKTTGGNDGLLSIQTNGSTAMSINASQQVTFNNGANLPNTFGFKNRIINGEMDISQRGAVNVTAAGGDTYIAADRFTLTNYWGSGQVNTAQSTTAPTGFSRSLSLTVATPAPMSGSTGYVAALWQAIEGFNIADAYTDSITLSFWVRSSITGTYSVTFSNVRSTGIGSTSRLYVANYTINAANTWEQKTITLSLSAGVASGTWDTSNSTGLCVAWNLGAESNRKGNTFLNTWGTLGSTPDLQSSAQTQWISNSGATFFLTGVQVERGSTATSFDFRSYGQELALCQRYYERLVWPQGTNCFNLIHNTSNTSQSIGTFSLLVPKRGAPSSSCSAAATFFSGNLGNAWSITSILGTNASQTNGSILLQLSSSPSVTASYAFVPSGQTAFFVADAEL